MHRPSVPWECPEGAIIVKTQFTVFTKPWPDKPLAELGDFVRDLGFAGIELPVRPGFQVAPENVNRDLPEAAKTLADRGVKIGSVAGPTDRVTIEACGRAGVPVIRVCPSIDMRIGYMATEKKIRAEYNALLPVLADNGVAIGVQNHCGYDVGSAIGIMHLIENYNPKQIGAVLDLAHCGLDGEPDDMAIDIVWSHLLIVNFKSAFRVRKEGPEVRDAAWEVYWTCGGHGITNWQKSAEELKRRGFGGDICLTAEYSRRDMADRIIAEDIRYARSLFS